LRSDAGFGVDDYSLEFG
jgi:hypothetical protein